MNASTDALWRARAGPGSPAWLRCWAATAAPPTDPRALVRTWAGRPGGSSAASRLVYRDAATLPITATPRVPPNSRVEPLTAEAMPPFSFGTAPRMDSVAGAWVSPIPRPSTTICAEMMP
jgi:hypothetical protein